MFIIMQKEHNIPYRLLNPIVLGDVDNNGIINIMDATIAQKSCIGMIPELTGDQKKCADVNRDGIVNIRDVTLIQMYVAGIITEF